jgi:hypothetical protein
MRIIILTAFLFIFSSVSQGNSNNRVWVKDNVIYYVGHLTTVLNNEVFQLYEENKAIKLIAIQSKGGEVNTGLDLGLFIYSNGLHVRVDSYCLSSCANYIFTAGSVKYVSSNSLIAFHGGATSESVMNDTLLEQQPISERKILIDKYKINRKKLVIREKEFFDRIGVQQRITTIGEANKFLPFWEEEYVGWYYTKGSLSKLGVKDIVVDGVKWEPIESLNELKFFRIRDENVF